MKIMSTIQVQKSRVIDTLERRIDALESEIENLREELSILSSTPEKDWKKAVGIATDDELGREAVKLGREWRETANQEE